MKKRALGLGVVSLFLLASCGSDAGTVESDPAAYNKCLEEEAVKWLDETGSNFDYANEKAAEVCSDFA